LTPQQILTKITLDSLQEAHKHAMKRESVTQLMEIANLSGAMVSSINSGETEFYDADTANVVQPPLTDKHSSYL